MAAGRGATPTPAKGRCSSCRSHRTGTQPETGPSEGALWPNRGGGAPALPGEGDRRGQSSQDRAGQTRGPWTRRCPKQLRGESPSYWKQLLGMCVFSPFCWSPDQHVRTSVRVRVRGLCSCRLPEITGHPHCGPATPCRVLAAGSSRGCCGGSGSGPVPACCLAVGTSPGWPPTSGPCPASAQDGVLGNRRSYPEPSSPGSCSAPFSPTWNCSCDLILPVWL